MYHTYYEYNIIMNIVNKYSLYEPCVKNSCYWINYFIKKGANDWNYGLYGACKGKNN